MEEPIINAGQFEISEEWIKHDRDPWAIGVLFGVANYNEERMMERNWPKIAQALRDSKWNRLSGQFGPTKASFFLTAGRVLWTLSRGDEQISFLSYEQKDNDWWGGSIQSLECKLSTALSMINDVATGDVALIHDSDLTIA